MFENIRSWWRRNKDVRYFFRGFVYDSYYEIKGWGNIKETGASKYPAKTKLGQDLIKTVSVLYDYLCEQGTINKIFRFSENPYVAGMALYYSFFGYNFFWVEEHGPDKIEPWLCDYLVMNEEMYKKYEYFIDELELVDALEVCGSEDNIEEGDCMANYFFSMAKPLCVFDIGERVVSDSSVEYIVDNDELFMSLHERPRGWVRAGSHMHYPFVEILQEVNWKEANLPFYAWDVGLADGPVDK